MQHAPTALVRPPGSAIRRAINGHFDPSPIDPAQALVEHQQVVEGLRWVGFEVRSLPADDHPDSCFIEDHAVVIGSRALLTRMGAEVRRAEAGSTHSWLASRFDTLSMTDGTLDGGDVLVKGRHILVGMGPRTRPSAVPWLQRAFPTHHVIAVDVPVGELHLKCVASAPGGHILSAIDLPVEHERIPWDERYAANAVGWRNRVLLPRGYPRVEQAVRDSGREVRTVDLNHLRRADGSLTCLSLRLSTDHDSEDGW